MGVGSREREITVRLTALSKYGVFRGGRGAGKDGPRFSGSGARHFGFEALAMSAASKRARNLPLRFREEEEPPEKLPKQAASKKYVPATPAPADAAAPAAQDEQQARMATRQQHLRTPRTPPHPRATVTIFLHEFRHFLCRNLPCLIHIC